MSSSRSVAIVGGGLAGLAAAAYLGRAGHHVTVFERSEMPGGRAGTTEKNGYLHNFGPHALYQGGAATRVLEELGVTYTGKKPDVQGVAVRGGRAYTLPTGARTMVATRLFGMRSRMEAGRQLLALRKIDPSDGRTVREWLDEEFHEPAARDYVEAIIRLATYANAPAEIPVADASRQMAGVGNGVVYVVGGWRMLVEALAASARAAGAVIRTAARVSTVEAEARGMVVRLASGEAVRFDAAIIAAPPAVAAELAPASRELAMYAAEAIPARAACLDVGLTRLPNPRRRFGLGIDVPVYMSAHSFYAKLAPRGRVLLSVARYIPAGEATEPARDLAQLEAFLDVAQPGWRQFEEHRQYLPNMVVSSAVPRRGAGIQGRPSPVVSDVPGLFVAGDWVGNGGWIGDGTLGSAPLAAEAVSAWLAEQTAPVLAAVS